jgi:hypothetical protein
MDDIEQSYATDPRNAAKPKRTRAKKTAAVTDEQAEAREAALPPEYDFSRGHHEPHHVENAEHPKPQHAEEQPRKKWTPPKDPFGCENVKAGENRVQLLKSEREGAWVIRFAHNPNQDKGLEGETYTKETPHPVLKMLKDEGYRWGFDGGDGKGGWGKKFDRDAYQSDHMEARRVLHLAAEMIGAPKQEQGRIPD